MCIRDRSDITYEYDCIFEKLVEELQPYDFVVNCRGNLVNLRHIEKIKDFIIIWIMEKNFRLHKGEATILEKK